MTFTMLRLNPACHQIQKAAGECRRCGGTWLYVTRGKVPSPKHRGRFHRFLRRISPTYADRLKHTRPRPAEQRAGPWNCTMPLTPLTRHEQEFRPRRITPHKGQGFPRCARPSPDERQAITEQLDD